jgi:DNA (cytosine-5)-methyltransferase 1
MKFIVIDLFAGAGGTTTGIEAAKVNNQKIAEVIAAINHDDYAIKSHAANHPNVKHYIEDIKDFDVNKLPEIKSNEETRVVMWASLECTNFSNAKGGLPRDADSRTLAEHLPRYIIKVNPDYLIIENVREFMAWGPLDETGKPISRDKGRDYLRWIKKIQSYGYDYDYRLINSADLGAHTSRKRLFIIFSKYHVPAAFPIAEYCKKGDLLPKYKPVKECLDFSDKGRSIFGRKKPLSEKTYRRIYFGCVKHIAAGDESFLTQYNGGMNDDRVLSVNQAINAITTCNRYALFQPEFLIKYHGNGQNHFSVCESCSALTTKDRLAFIQPDFFIDMRHSNGQINQSVNKPLGSILTIPKQCLISADRLCFIDEQYGQSRGASIENPSGTITANPKLNLVSAETAWVMNTNFNNIGNTANRKHHYLMNPQYASKGSSIDEPAFTLIAKMDKRPPYLITTESGDIAIEIYDTDSEYIKKIKMFMAAYGIIDIKMRMLRVDELLKIQGFPEDYILHGTQAQKKKFIGNAVVPIVAQKIFEALYIANIEQKEYQIKKAV